MTKHVSTQMQVDWLYRVCNFEVNRVQDASFAEIAAAQANLKARLADLPRMFPQAFVDAVPEVNSYGHLMGKLDQLSAEMLYYVGEVAEATTAFGIEEACKYFEYILEDWLPAVEAAGLATDHLDELEEAYL